MIFQHLYNLKVSTYDIGNKVKQLKFAKEINAPYIFTGRLPNTKSILTSNIGPKTGLTAALDTRISTPPNSSTVWKAEII